MTNQRAQPIHLPVRPFLFTLDQIGTIIGVTEQTLRTQYVFLAGRTPGVQPLDWMLANNIAPPAEKPDWRVEERELLRWLRRKGFRVV